MTDPTSIGKLFDDGVALERLSGPISPVAGRESPWSFVAGLAGTFGLGLIVFLSLSAGRHARAQATVPAPRPVQLAQVGQQPVPAPVQTPAPVPEDPNPALAADEAARLHAPSMVVDLSEAPPQEPATLSGTHVAQAGAASKTAAGGDSGAKLGSDERFAQRVTGAQVDTAHATRLSNTALIAPQGTVISAVLETGINSDLPGFARAVVSRDISGFDGSTVVIPRGTRLIGEYKSGVANGQSRAFVIWARLITPDGVSVSLGSPGTDRLGRGGLEGRADTHFFHRFGAAILLSVIDGAVQAFSNQYSSGNTGVVISSPQQAASIASIALQKDIDIPTTITVPQGQAIRVFVARDLDFSDVLQAQ